MRKLAINAGYFNSCERSGGRLYGPILSAVEILQLAVHVSVLRYGKSDIIQLSPHKSGKSGNGDKSNFFKNYIDSAPLNSKMRL
jgi:hypothetical protein